MIRPLKLLAMGCAVLSLLVGFSQRGGAEEQYTVKPGDTLYGISKSFGISIEALKKANALEGDLLKPKQVLILPLQGEKKEEGPGKRPLTPAPKKLVTKNVKKISKETDSYAVQKGDSLSSISKRMGHSVEEMKSINGLSTSNLKIGQVLLLPREGGQWDETVEKFGDGEDVGGILQKEEEQGEPAIFFPLGKWNNPEERNLFVRVVKTFLGVPYKLGGSTLKGIDCSAFVKKIYEIFKIELPRTVREQLSIGKKVERDQLEEGDLVFFKRRGNRAHVGIYIGDNQFIHASYRNREVKIDRLDMPYFSTRFIKGVRVMELERGELIMGERPQGVNP